MAKPAGANSTVTASRGACLGNTRPLTWALDAVNAGRHPLATGCQPML